MSDEYKYKWTQCTNGRTGEKNSASIIHIFAWQLSRHREFTIIHTQSIMNDYAVALQT